MQGTIWVESVLGTGSTFTVLLPAALHPAPAGQGPIVSPVEAAPTSRIDHVASIPHLAG
jgi:chemotaxis protein histidine kinase CheA